jgi:peptidoglycan hydrolase CwlO-like protein
MKGRFEDYQKYLDTLNGKIEGVNKDIEELREKFNEEDMEKDNQFIMVLDNEVEYCDIETNGDKNSRS